MLCKDCINYEEGECLKIKNEGIGDIDDVKCLLKLLWLAIVSQDDEGEEWKL